MKCPTCGGAPEKAHSPFCSRRCAQADLGRWFSGQYSIPIAGEPDSADLDELEEAMTEAVQDGKIIKGNFGQ